MIFFFSSVGSLIHVPKLVIRSFRLISAPRHPLCVMALSFSKTIPFFHCALCSKNSHSNGTWNSTQKQIRLVFYLSSVSVLCEGTSQFFSSPRSKERKNSIFFKNAVFPNFIHFFLDFSLFFQCYTKSSQVCPKLPQWKFPCVWLNFWQTWDDLGKPWNFLEKSRKIEKIWEKLR